MLLLHHLLEKFKLLRLLWKVSLTDFFVYFLIHVPDVSHALLAFVDLLAPELVLAVQLVALIIKGVLGASCKLYYVWFDDLVSVAGTEDGAVLVLLLLVAHELNEEAVVDEVHFIVFLRLELLTCLLLRLTKQVLGVGEHLEVLLCDDTMLMVFKAKLHLWLVFIN